MSIKDERSRLYSFWHFTVSFAHVLWDGIRQRPFEPSLFLILLFISCGIYEYLAYNVGLLSSQFYSALTNHNEQLMTETVRFAILYIFSISMAVAVRAMISGHLSIELREALTARMNNLYFYRKNYYTVNKLRATDGFVNFMDNPDQRLTQDIGTACKLFCETLPVLLMNPVLIVFYTYKCVVTAGWLGPFSAYTMFIVFTILTRLVTTWTSSAVYDQDREEGNFRFAHSRFRCFVEEAAFLNLGRVEHNFNNMVFQRLLQASVVSVNRTVVLLYCTTLCAYIGSVLNFFAIGAALFSGILGQINASEIAHLISKTSFFLLYLINSLTNLLDIANKLAQMIGIGQRILTLYEQLNDCSDYVNPALHLADRIPLHNHYTIIRPQVGFPTETSNNSSPSVDTAILLNHLSICLPTRLHRVLISNLTLCIRLYQHLVITGPSGVGKTALLRVLADLWPAFAANQKQIDSCSFFRAPGLSQFYVSQKPFIPSCNIPPKLWELSAFVYSQIKNSKKSDELKHAVQFALHSAHMILTMAPPVQVVQADISDHMLSLDSVTFDYQSLQLSTKLCGYTLQSYCLACDLLVEFRLINSMLSQRIQEIFQRYSLDESTIDQSIPASYGSIVSFLSSQSCVCYQKFKSLLTQAFRFIVHTVAGGCQPVRTLLNDDSTVDLQNSYSPGELQRLMLAAVCFGKPQIVFLDEATSHLNEVDEREAYKSLHRRQITTVSVAHRESVQRYHQFELRLFPSASNLGFLEESPEPAEPVNCSESITWKLIKINDLSIC